MSNEINCFGGAGSKLLASVEKWLMYEEEAI